MTNEPNAETLPTAHITYNTTSAALQAPSQLTMAQSRFLASYVIEGTIRAACKSAGITPDQHYHWIRSSEPYREKFRSIAAVSLDEARARLDVLAPKAAEVFEEGLERDKSLEVTCPACEHEFTVRIADYRTRLTVAKELFKRSGDLAAKLQVSGEVKHRDMALEDRLALAQLQAWAAQGRQGLCPVPPDVYDDLSRRGLFDATAQGSHAPLLSSQELNSTLSRAARNTYREQDEPDVLDGVFSDALDAEP